MGHERGPEDTLTQRPAVHCGRSTDLSMNARTGLIRMAAMISTTASIPGVAIHGVELSHGDEAGSRRIDASGSIHDRPIPARSRSRAVTFFPACVDAYAHPGVGPGNDHQRCSLAVSAGCRGAATR